MHKVTIKGSVIYANDGELLSNVLRKEGIYHEHPCGGKGTCKKCELLINGRPELSCQYKINSDIDVMLNENEEAMTATDNLSDGEAYALALDLGTTTLALALVSSDGNVMALKTAINPQRGFGADVISLIEYCSTSSYIEPHKAIISKLNDMIGELNIKSPLPLFVAGNTVMLHLFFGIDPSSIGVAPYTPKFLEERNTDGAQIGLSKVSEVHSLPCISSFVGADIVAGLSVLPTPKKNKYSILIDLGTNAEIALFSSEGITCTSAAAGPAFEGANISCGMSAVHGALYSFYLDEQGNKSIKTVGDGECIGICGTGLIDVVANLIQNELIDKTGYLENEIYRITNEISITENDVRNLSLAKSAICSALLTLMRSEGVSFDMIDTLFISGGFSTRINVRNAVCIGLIPSALANKCVPISNSSLLGAVSYAVHRQSPSSIVKKARYTDLAKDNGFSDLFIKNLSF